jgi:hypothetical protein
MISLSDLPAAQAAARYALFSSGVTRTFMKTVLLMLEYYARRVGTSTKKCSHNGVDNVGTIWDKRITKRKPETDR